MNKSTPYLVIPLMALLAFLTGANVIVLIFMPPAFPLWVVALYLTIVVYVGIRTFFLVLNDYVQWKNQA